MKEVSAQTVTMSSLEIAAATGKRHCDVIRDIRKMLDAIPNDDADLRHLSEHKDNRGYTREFSLPRLLVESLLLGYSVPLRLKVLTRLHELEDQFRVQPPQPAVGSKAWQYEREAGKVQRLSLTDTIRDHLIPLATEQGSENAGRLYQVYSRMVNQALDYPAGQRDVMAVADLNRLEAAEEFAAQQIITLGTLKVGNKAIYQAVKEAVARFVGSLPVIRPIRLALN
jgi:hypothetical protein